MQDPDLPLVRYVSVGMLESLWKLWILCLDTAVRIKQDDYVKGINTVLGTEQTLNTQYLLSLLENTSAFHFLAYSDGLI